MLLWSLQDIRLVDLNAAAVLAMEKELSMLTSHAYISFTGNESDCSAAVLQLQQALQVGLSCVLAVSDATCQHPVWCMSGLHIT